MLYPAELRALLSAFCSSADLKLRPLKKLFLLSHLTQQQAVLDKRANVIGAPNSRQQQIQKFQLDKGVTTAVSRFAFAV